MAASVKEVAAEAGVSVGTVSNGDLSGAVRRLLRSARPVGGAGQGRVLLDGPIQS